MGVLSAILELGKNLGGFTAKISERRCDLSGKSSSLEAKGLTYMFIRSFIHSLIHYWVPAMSQGLYRVLELAALPLPGCRLRLAQLQFSYLWKVDTCSAREPMCVFPSVKECGIYVCGTLTWERSLISELQRSNKVKTVLGIRKSTTLWTDLLP